MATKNEKQSSNALYNTVSSREREREREERESG